MRLKTFQARTMTEAMKQVRDTLGEEAVIISTSEENNGVRVTAAIEHMDDLPDPYPHDYKPLASRQQERPQFSNDLSAPKDAQEKEYLQYDAEEDFEGQITEELTDIMLRHVVPTEVMDNILATAAMTGLGNTNSALMAALDHLYKFVPLPAKSKRKALMLVGPPGAGKTLMVAKMATRAVMDGLNVAVITTDTVRAGGVEQLQAFTKILDIPLQKAKTRDDLNKALNQTHDHDVVIIDTAGTNPHDPDDMARVGRLIDAGSIEPILAMTAGVDAEESSEIAQSFALLGVQRMVATRLDIARRLGGLLSAAQKGGLTFCDISFTPKVTDGLSPMTPNLLAEFLINPDRALRSSTTPETENKKTVGQKS
jgi:flagellar biosynthesis protein FlhF